MNKEVGMMLQKIADTSGVGISNMRKSMFLLTTAPTNYTYTFYPHP